MYWDAQFGMDAGKGGGKGHHPLAQGEGIGHTDVAHHQAVDSAHHRNHHKHRDGFGEGVAKQAGRCLCHMGVAQGHDLLRSHIAGDAHKIGDIDEQNDQGGHRQSNGKVPPGAFHIVEDGGGHHPAVIGIGDGTYGSQPANAGKRRGG